MLKALELKIPPLALAALGAAAMAGCAWAWPTLSRPFAGRALLALLLVLAGAAVALAGVLAFRRHHTTVNPFTPDATRTVVSSGIYGRTRNPMYLGFLLALAGWAAWLANGAALLVLPVFVLLMNRLQIAPEERTLRAHFGAEYQGYCARVRRWI